MLTPSLMDLSQTICTVPSRLAGSVPDRVGLEVVRSVVSSGPMMPKNFTGENGGNRHFVLGVLCWLLLKLWTVPLIAPGRLCGGCLGCQQASFGVSGEVQKEICWGNKRRQRSGENF